MLYNEPSTFIRSVQLCACTHLDIRISLQMISPHYRVLNTHWLFGDWAKVEHSRAEQSRSVTQRLCEGQKRRVNVMLVNVGQGCAHWTSAVSLRDGIISPPVRYIYTNIDKCAHTLSNIDSKAGIMTCLTDRREFYWKIRWDLIWENDGDFKKR